MLAPGKERLVVVGNGMAGMRTVEQLLARAPSRYELTVFGAEPYPNYNRILLSSVLAGETALDQIVIHPRSWYARHRVRLIEGDPVIAIDRAAKTVVSAADPRGSSARGLCFLRYSRCREDGGGRAYWEARQSHWRRPPGA